MDFEKMPSRPVISSQLAANLTVEKWMQENLNRHIKDTDGLNWRVKVDIKQRPSQTEFHGSEYIIKLWVEANVSAEEFMASKVLDEDEDARLLSLIGSDLVPLRLRPLEFSSRNLEEARNLTLAHSDSIAQKLSKIDLKPIKRKLISRFIDSRGVFGSRQNQL